MPTSRFIVCVLSVFLALSRATLAQNLFQNDSFESVTPPLPPNSFRQLTGAAADDVDNWVTDSGGGIYVLSSGGSPLTGGPASPGGTNLIDFASNSNSDSFTQNVSLTNGHLYQFGFDIAENFATEPHGKLAFDLLVNGNVVASFSTLNLTTAWVPLSADFTYTGVSGLVPVTLRGTVVVQTGNQDYLTDRYYLIETVPEPSTIALLAVGLAAAFAARPRSRVS